VITEKATLLKEGGKYVFEVQKGSRKREIGRAVEKAFHVRVKSVNIVNLHGEMIRRGRMKVKTSPHKKAIVTLMPGEKIEFFEGI
jgi:large subunit ribosomal protein L23